MKSRIAIDEIYFAALERESDSARSAYLDEVCGGDDELRNRIERLLSARPHVESFLEQPEQDLTAASIPIEECGDQIGPYKLLEVIGQGGMGTVYMAEQTEPVNRRVALKLIKTGMDTRQVVARFEAERQALAVMDHPNIAKVLDAGATQSGRPYFVMELVKGKPINRFCDEQKMDTEARLKLFQQVCHAIQHAHQKGIIHRDIKPSNVLVAMYDDKPVPKVIDFGVAKATGEKLTEKTMFTRFGQIVGTLEYMSPEQAQFNQLDIDTRSDIYSLGAILYELLTGGPPFDIERIKSQALDETLRMIREDDPTRPSTKLSSIAQPAKIASNRRTTAGKLSSKLRGDLDWIVMKALEKERSRRYESANSLANDIDRHLNNDAIEARPPDHIYRLRKFARKHKAGMAVAVLSMLIVTLGVVALTVSNSFIRAEQNKTLAALHETKQQRDRAIDAEKKAEAKAEELKVVSKFQAGVIGQIDTFAAGQKLKQHLRAQLKKALAKSELNESERGRQIENHENLWKRVNATDVASELIDQVILKSAIVEIERRFADQPLVAARLRSVLSEIYASLGRSDEALALAEQATATFHRELGENNVDTLVARGNLAISLANTGRLNEAEPMMRDVVRQSRQWLGDDHQVTLSGIANLGGFLSGIYGVNSEAEALVREAMQGQLNHPELGNDHLETLESMIALGNILSRNGKFSEAESILRKTVQGYRSNPGEGERRLFIANDILGSVLMRVGKFDEAEQIYRENLTLRRQLLGDSHPQTLVSINNLAGLAMQRGKVDEAEEFYLEALNQYRRLSLTENRTFLNVINNLGVLYYNQFNFTEAEKYFRETVEIKRRVLNAEHPDLLSSLSNLGNALRKQGKLSEAEPYVREAYSSGQRIYDAGDPRHLYHGTALAFLLHDQSKYEEAVALFEDIKEPAEQTFAGDNSSQYAGILMGLGKALTGKGDFSAAEASLLEAYDLNLKYPGPSQPQETIKKIEALINLYTAWNKAEPNQSYAEKTEEWKGKLSELTQSQAEKENKK